jgi:hypothetical protein
MNGSVAAVCGVAVQPSLFNDPAFHRLNGVEGILLGHAHDGRPIGSLGGALLGERFESGHSAPFGGFDVVREREAPGQVGALVDATLAQLRERGVREVVIRCAPACHQRGAAESAVFSLLDRGFTVRDADLNSHLDLRGLAAPDDYVASLRPPARRALRHAADDPWSVEDAGENRRAWQRGYAILAANRAARGRTLSLSEEYVWRARIAFPEQVRMLILRHDRSAVAAALSYRVLPHVELVVAWGDAGHDLPRSPMNRLAYEVVARALAERIATVDLGVSTVRGEDGRRTPDDGLLRFKQSIGAVVQTRLVLEGRL